MSGKGGQETRSPYLRLAKDVFAGTCGGIAVTLVGHPFDTVKVRLQSQPGDKPIYNGALDCVKKTLKWEGPQGLYKGVTSPLAGQMFFRATLFGAFGQSKSWLGTNSDGSSRPLSVADLYKAGAMTGFAAAFVEGPIDFYKSQIQYQIIKKQIDPAYKPPYTSVFRCAQATVQISGFKGPFQGLGATLIRNVPANSIYLGTFDLLKRKAAVHYNCTVPELSSKHPLVVFNAAGVGALGYWIAIFPVDVIKSAMQTDSIDPTQRRFPTMATTFQKLYAEGGIRRFYKGFSPCLLRAVPANGAMLLTVDTVTSYLK